MINGSGRLNPTFGVLTHLSGSWKNAQLMLTFKHSMSKELVVCNIKFHPYGAEN